MKEQLLLKAESVKNGYSFDLFLLEHIKEHEKIVNCKGIQESDHEC